MTLRETLLKNKPKLTPITINGDTYYLREFTVGEMNNALYGQQQELVLIAEQQGIELNYEDESELAKQLTKIYDPHRLSRMLATRLCDEQGNNLFNPENIEDLTALSQLDKTVYEQLVKAVSEQEPKNSQTDESSS